MHVRIADPQDVDQIRELLIEFALAYNEKGSFAKASEEYQFRLINELITKHVVFVAEAESKIVGVIGGLIAPHLFNPAITTATELFWYVHADFRNTSAGARLLASYKNHVAEIADLIYMVLLDNSPVKPDSLIKRGFYPKETHYMYEV